MIVHSIMSIRTTLIQISAVGGIVLSGYASWVLSRKLQAARERRLARQNYWSGVLLGIKFAFSAAALG